MCADPLKGFVFVLSRLQISQAWIWALLSGPASEIQPPGHPPARTRGRNIITARLIIIPTSERRWALIFSIFGSHFQIQRPKRPRARIWGRKKNILGVTLPIQRPGRPRAGFGGAKKHFWGRTSRSNIQGALERGFYRGQRNNFFGVTPPAPTSSALERGFGRAQKNLGGHTRAPRAPSSADLGRQKKIFFGTSPRSNAQGALERGFGGANSRFWGSHGQIPCPGRPSSADLGGQKKNIFWNKPQIQRPGRPRARIWGGKLKILGGRISRSNVQGALERGFGGAKTIFGLAPPNPTFRAPSSADMGWRANYPSSTAHWKRKKYS